MSKATQLFWKGQILQSGFLGLHWIAPKSIIAWLYVSGWSVAINDCAKSLNSLIPFVEFIGVFIPKNLDNTLYTFPSTTAAGSLKQIEAIADAV